MSFRRWAAPSSAGDSAATPDALEGVLVGNRLLAYEETDRASLERRVIARKRENAVRRILGGISGETGAAGGGGR